MVHPSRPVLPSMPAGEALVKPGPIAGLLVRTNLHEHAGQGIPPGLSNWQREASRKTAK